jgi:putative heme transporter
MLRVVRDRRRLLKRVAAVAFVVVVFVIVLPRVADYRDVWDVVKGLDAESILVLVVATIANLATFGPPLMSTLPGLGYWRAFVVTQASTASTYVAPGGAAVGIAAMLVLLRRWGFRTSAVGLAVALTGLWNQFAVLGFPAVALALLTLTGGKNPLLQTVAVIGFSIFVAAVVAFAVTLASDRFAHRVGGWLHRLAQWGYRIARRGPVGWTAEAVVEFRSRTALLLARRWHVLTVATLAGQLTVFGVLLASLRTLGVSGGEVSLIEAFAAWSLIRLLGSLPITPGGIGVIEVGLTTLLVGFGGSQAEVVAAVLVYRFLTIVPTLVLGLVLGPTIRRRPVLSTPEG